MKKARFKIILIMKKKFNELDDKIYSPNLKWTPNKNNSIDKNSIEKTN